MACGEFFRTKSTARVGGGGRRWSDPRCRSWNRACIGRSGRDRLLHGTNVPGRPSPYNRPETIEETAELINAAGGLAVARRVDHTVEAEVEALFRSVHDAHGRLDIVVNSIAGEDPSMAQWCNFWKTDLTNAETALRQSLLSHIITAKHAARYMIRQHRGLIVEVTESDILGAGGNPVTQTVKLALKGLALNMAGELRPHGVAAVAITPGFLRSEAMLERLGVSEANWRDAGKKDKNFLQSETPLFIGRAVVALARDPGILDRSGQLFSSWELGRQHRFTDADGRRPDWGAAKIDFSRHPEMLVDLLRDGAAIQLRWLNEVTRRTRHFQSRLPRAQPVRTKPRGLKRTTH